MEFKMYAVHLFVIHARRLEASLEPYCQDALYIATNRKHMLEDFRGEIIWTQYHDNLKGEGLWN